MDANNAIAVFQGRNIRRTWYKDEWWFVVEDIVTILTDSKDTKQYINKMRNRDEELYRGGTCTYPFNSYFGRLSAHELFLS